VLCPKKFPKGSTPNLAPKAAIAADGEDEGDSNLDNDQLFEDLARECDDLEERVDQLEDVHDCTALVGGCTSPLPSKPPTGHPRTRNKLAPRKSGKDVEDQVKLKNNSLTSKGGQTYHSESRPLSGSAAQKSFTTPQTLPPEPEPFVGWVQHERGDIVPCESWIAENQDLLHCYDWEQVLDFFSDHLASLKLNKAKPQSPPKKGDIYSPQTKTNLKKHLSTAQKGLGEIPTFEPDSSEIQEKAQIQTLPDEFTVETAASKLFSKGVYSGQPPEKASGYSFRGPFWRLQQIKALGKPKSKVGVGR
jgi:hypothetical protein